MEKNEKEQRISIRFPLDMLEAIRKRSKENDRSFNREVVHLLRVALKLDEKKEG